MEGSSSTVLLTVSLIVSMPREELCVLLGKAERIKVGVRLQVREWQAHDS